MIRYLKSFQENYILYIGYGSFTGQGIVRGMGFILFTGQGIVGGMGYVLFTKTLWISHNVNLGTFWAVLCGQYTVHPSRPVCLVLFDLWVLIVLHLDTDM